MTQASSPAAVGPTPEPSPSLDVAAIVVAYQSGPALIDALEALRIAGATQLIVVDNGSTAAEAAALDRLAVREGVHVLRGHGNVGFARGCNLGAERATAAHLLFANPDLVIAPDAIAALIAALREAPSPAVVGGRLFGLDGREQRGARRDLYTPWNVFVAMTRLSALERLAPAFRNPHRERDPAPDHPIEVGAVSGALMAFRRADFEALGGFDEGYPLHVEDVDICRRAKEAGGVALFAPGARGVHAGGGSRAPRERVERAKAAGFARYFRKFARSPLERLVAAAIAPALAPTLLFNARLKRGRSST